MASLGGATGDRGGGQSGDTGRTVSCVLTVLNTTKFPLTECHVSTRGGELHIPPSSVAPGASEVMVARKKAFSLSGTYGTVSWKVEGTGYRLVVMWHCPWDFVFNDANWLGIGVIKDSADVKGGQRKWYDVMFHNVEWDSSSKESWRQEKDGLQFHSQRFYNDISPLRFECKEGGFSVEGTMSNSHNATAKITIVPHNDYDRALSSSLSGRAIEISQVDGYNFQHN